MSMNVSPELRPNRYDLLVALVVLILAIALGARSYLAPASGGALAVVISADGEEIERTPLAQYAAGEHTYSANGYTLIVTAGDGTLSVTASDCPGQDCVHSGAISRAGQSIVCLPARITIQLAGAGGDYDLVTG